MVSSSGSVPPEPRPAIRLALSRALIAFAALLLFGGCDVQKSFIEIPVGGFWQRLSPPADSICFYPDWRGDRIVFTAKLSLAQTQSYRVALMRADGSKDTVYAGSSQWNDYAPRWVDDRLVVLYSNRSGTYDIWYLDLQTGVYRSLAAVPGNEVSPVPRPGTPGLVFAEVRPSGSSLDGRIALISDTTAAFSDVRYLSPDSLHAGEPDWDPTGTRVCFTASGSDPVRHLWLTTINGSDTTLTQLTTGSDEDANPRFSPDGSRIVFVSTRNGIPGLWVVDAAGESAGLREVAKDDPGAFLGTPAWSPDEHSLVVSSNGRLGALGARQQPLWLLLNLGL